MAAVAQARPIHLHHCGCSRQHVPGTARSRAAHLKASPMACAPVAQAVATAWLGPCRPCAMLTAPAAMLTSVLGTKNGLSRRSLPSACAYEGSECSCGAPGKPAALASRGSRYEMGDGASAACHSCRIKGRESDLTQWALTISTPASAMSVVQLMPAPIATPVACRCSGVSGRHLASCRACSRGGFFWKGWVRYLGRRENTEGASDHARASSWGSTVAPCSQASAARVHATCVHFGACLCRRSERVAHEFGGAPAVLLRRPGRCCQLILGHAGHHLAGQLR